VELALVAIVLFAMLMFTRRRLAAVETRARSLKDSVEMLELKLRLQAEQQQSRFAAIENALNALPGDATEAALAQAGPWDAARSTAPTAEDPSAPLQSTSASFAGATTLIPSDATIGDRRGLPLTAASPADRSTIGRSPDFAGASPLPGTSASAGFAGAAPGVPAGSQLAAASAAAAAGPGSAGGGGRPPGPPSPAQPASPAPPDPILVAIEFLRELVLGGNTVVRAGIVVLLVGVVLLLRWASEHALFPIELRLAGAAVLAIALCVVGFSQRNARPGFSRTLQGGGIAALYLVVFFAFRTYELLPAPLAFALLVGIALCSGILAVVQNSTSLIFIAQAFGFLAPLLASTGKGSHVALFSYYLLLNLVVAGVAWFKAWRSLNLLGFAFTFGIASAWGVLRYEPQNFATTEPFLIAFFLLYVAIPVLFALRHPGSRRGWVDGSLVFGTPLAALALQWALVHDRPFAMAYSALAMGALYVGLVLFIRRRAPDRLAALGEAFLPIGVGFATLAIPYGLDDHNLTGAAWAIEGAGLYWVGVRQNRWLSRVAGFALQFIAGAALALDPERPDGALPMLNTWFLAGTMLGVSSLFVAAQSYAARAKLGREWRLVQVLIPWGLLFVLGAGFGEITAHVPLDLRPGAVVAWLGAVALGLELVAGALAWQPGRYPGLLLWIAMIGLLGRHHYDLDVQPFARGGFIGWPLYAAAMGLILRRFVPQAHAFVRYAHPTALWLWTAFGVSLAEHLVSDAAGMDRSYVVAASLATLVAIVLSVLALAPRPSWPVGHEPMLYVRFGLGGVVVVLLLRILYASLTQPGSNAPIAYLPLANALDASLLLALVAIFAWIRRGSDPIPGIEHAESAQPLLPAKLRKLASIALAAVAFVFWNGLIARTVHHYAGVPFWPDALWSSVALQVALSLSWTLIALALMIGGHRRRLRPAWWTGAALLAIVVAKLFLLDLAELSAGAKIGTFLGVGLLLLLIGALAPVPPPAAVAAPPDPEPEPAPRPSHRPEAPT
jgi:uncharacterized membrane protein